MDDKYRKGRGEHSANKNAAKLTAEAVADIRKRELRQCDYARKYGVSKSTIRLIWIGKTWAT